jgi:hypothetical protein
MSNYGIPPTPIFGFSNAGKGHSASGSSSLRNQFISKIVGATSAGGDVISSAPRSIDYDAIKEKMSSIIWDRGHVASASAPLYNRMPLAQQPVVIPHAASDYLSIAATRNKIEEANRMREASITPPVPTPAKSVPLWPQQLNRIVPVYEALQEEDDDIFAEDRLSDLVHAVVKAKGSSKTPTILEAATIPPKSGAASIEQDSPLATAVSAPVQTAREKKSANVVNESEKKALALKSDPLSGENSLLRVGEMVAYEVRRSHERMVTLFNRGLRETEDRILRQFKAFVNPRLEELENKLCDMHEDLKAVKGSQRSARISLARNSSSAQDLSPSPKRKNISSSNRENRADSHKASSTSYSKYSVDKRAEIASLAVDPAERHDQDIGDVFSPATRFKGRRQPAAEGMRRNSKSLN